MIGNMLTLLWKEFVAVIGKGIKQYEIDWREEYKTLLTV